MCLRIQVLRSEWISWLLRSGFSAFDTENVGYLYHICESKMYFSHFQSPDVLEIGKISHSAAASNRLRLGSSNTYDANVPSTNTTPQSELHARV